MSTENNFDQWCLVELFGHQQIAGRVSEAQIGGETFVRVDVPEVEGRPAFTKFYGKGAIYSITPVEEDFVMRYEQYHQTRPITVYVPPPPEMALPAGELFEAGSDGDDEEVPF
jgi:hypothetical protein